MQVLFQFPQLVFNQPQRIQATRAVGGRSGNVGRNILFRIADHVPEKLDVFVCTLYAVKKGLGLIAHGRTYLGQRKYRLMAERVGFEPTIPVKVCPLSRRIVSTTHAPLRVGHHSIGSLGGCPAARHNL